MWAKFRTNPAALMGRIKEKYPAATCAGSATPAAEVLLSFLSASTVEPATPQVQGHAQQRAAKEMATQTEEDDA